MSLTLQVMQELVHAMGHSQQQQKPQHLPQHQVSACVHTLTGKHVHAVMKVAYNSMMELQGTVHQVHIYAIIKQALLY